VEAKGRGARMPATNSEMESNRVRGIEKEDGRVRVLNGRGVGGVEGNFDGP
jgi:hypothetical protein